MAINNSSTGLLNHVLDTLLHKVRVARFMSVFAVRLMWRAVVHDNSKLRRPERGIYAAAAPRVQTITYGSAQYNENLSRLRAALAHHYRHNSHHPEYYPNGVADMDLLDLVEMVCDWQAAAKAQTDGDIIQSIAVNQHRFALSNALTGLLLNSVMTKGKTAEPGP